MSKAKTPIEKELDKYYYAAQSIERFENELSHIIDHHSERYKRISILIENENAIIDKITNMVDKADLSPLEREYVRLRHYEQKPLAQVARTLFVAVSTASRLRDNVIGKLQ